MRELRDRIAKKARENAKWNCEKSAGKCKVELRKKCGKMQSGIAKKVRENAKWNCEKSAGKYKVELQDKSAGKKCGIEVQKEAQNGNAE